MSETINGSKSSNYIKEPVPGISNSSDSLTHQSVQNLWDGRGAADVLIHGVYRPSGAAMTIEAGSVKRKIVVTGHGARAGDFFKLTSGASIGEEIAIIKAVDANNLIIAKEVNASIGDSVEIWRAVTPSYNSDGSLNVVANQGPVIFRKDGTPTEVNYDTATPTNSEALPVNIVTVNGQGISTTVDLSGAQINVQLSDRGTSPDSVLIGDGTEFLAINASNEAMVHDTDLLTKQTDGLQVTQIKSSEKGTSTSQALTHTIFDADHNALDVALLTEIPAGTQLIGAVRIDSTDNLVRPRGVYNLTPPTIADAGEAQLQLDANGKLLVTSNLITGFATSTNQTSVTGTKAAGVAATNSLLTGAVHSSTPPTVANGEQVALQVDSSGKLLVTSNLITGFATATNQTNVTGAKAPGVAATNSLLTGAVYNLTPPTLTNGQQASLQVDASGQLKIAGTVTATQGYVAGTLKAAQVTVGTSQVRATTDGAAPSLTRNKLLIKSNKNNSGSIFLIPAGGTISTGMEIIGPDRLEFLYDPTDYYLISDTAAQVVEILEVE
jgi:hypothetical protein